MTEFGSSLFAYTAAIILLTSGVVHANAVREFGATLAEHRLYPQRVCTPIAILVTALEISSGALIVVGVVAEDHRLPLEFTLAVAAGLFLAFAVYALVLLARRPLATCGCSPRETPITVLVPIRAAGLAAGCAIAAQTSSDVVRVGGDASSLVVVVVASISVASLIWVLPDAVLSPARLQNAYLRSAL